MRRLRCMVWIIEIVSDGFAGTKNPDAQEAFDLMLNSGYQAVRADETLSPVVGPHENSTNFLFFDARLSIDDVLGVTSDRVAPYS